MKKLAPPLMRLKLICCVALSLAACSTSQPASVEGLNRVAGDALPGAQGLTVEDQTAIDITVARLCAAEIFVSEECSRHTKASASRRAELAAEELRRELEAAGLDEGAAGV